MKNSKTLALLIHKYGKDVTVQIDAEKTNCRAIINPLRYKNKMYLDADMSDFGAIDRTRFLYIGPPEPNFTQKWDATTVVSQGQKYAVTRADMICVGDTPLYIWAVLGNVKE
ncbi:MAG: hypothetical protein IKV36_03605 [Clostridia bacterium]|nr:hypothetical protein [Clostridia bacterium]